MTLCWYCSRETGEGDIEFGNQVYHPDCFDKMWKVLIGQNNALRVMGEALVAKGEALIEAIEDGRKPGYEAMTALYEFRKAIAEYPKLIQKTPEVK